MIAAKKKLHLTNEQLSERSGVPTATVQKIFAGVTKAPRFETRQALEKVLLEAIESSNEENKGRADRLSGKVWNTRRNHFGWKLYLRSDARKVVSPYAAAAQETNYASLPPCYTFVGDGEPFYCETLEYVNQLKKAGVSAAVDVYHTNVHAFDMMNPDEENSRKAITAFDEQFEYALRNYFAENC